MLDRKVKGDLQRFKDFVEAKGGEAGAWRGEVDQDPTSDRGAHPYGVGFAAELRRLDGGAVLPPPRSTARRPLRREGA